MPENRTKDKTLIMSKISHNMIKLCFLFMFIFAIYGIVVSPKYDFFNQKVSEYTGEWTFIGEDGSFETFSGACELKTKVGEVVTITTVLPEIEEGDYFAITTGRSFKAYIDDVEIYSFDAKDSQIPGDEIKAINIPIPLKASYSGKELKFVRDNPLTYNGNVNRSYIGGMMGIIRLLTSQKTIQYIMALFLAIFALITVVVFRVISFVSKKEIPLVYLAEGVLAVCLWLIIDSPLFQFVFSKYYFDGPLGYMLAMMLTTPFLLYIDIIQSHRHHKMYILFEMFTVVNFPILTVLHFTGIMSYPNILLYMDSMIILCILIIIVVTLHDFFVLKKRGHMSVLIGFGGMMLLAMIETLMIVLRYTKVYSYNYDGIFIVIGLFFLLVFAIYDQLKYLSSLQYQTQKALAATKAKSDFLATMSHEIRTPINAIMGMNEMILRESRDESVKEYAKDISTASESLLEIVNDILDFSKIESGMLEIVNVEYNLGELIAEVTTLINMRAENKGLKLKILVNPELPQRIYGDEKRIREVMINILNNAVKYTDEGKITLKVDGEVENQMLSLSISISDTGHGIKKEDIEKIFVGFERVDLKKNRNVEGSGLGLSITRKLVELMEGQISVESEYGVGSTFTVVIPQKVIDPDRMGDYRVHKNASKEVATEKKSTFVAPKAEVLVVDDYSLNLRVIEKLLERNNIRVTSVTNGQDALKIMKERNFDVILLDHMMPNMDGIETLEASKTLEGNLNRNTPVVALTANAIVGAKEKYLEVGFTDYLSKPVSPITLEEMMLRFIPEEKVTFL